MKKKIIFGLSLLLAGSMTLFQVSCKKKPFDDLLINVDTDVLVSPTVVLFENAKSGATNQPGDFKITITGEDKDVVLSAVGNKTFEVQNGFIILNLEKGTVPTPANPVRFTINASIKGFEDLVKDIIISGTEEQSFTVKAVEIGNVPAGITEVSENFTLSNGTFTAEETIQTIAENGTTQVAKMTFATGTKMRDKDGNIIAGGTVAASVRYYDPNSESVDVFPGGLSPQNVYDENNQRVQGGGEFFSAGLLDINLKVGTKDVKTFETPVATEVELNSNQLNFETGELIKAGEKIPLWSMDKGTGIWKNEGFATVVAKEGKLIAEFEIDHLSYWNLDYFQGSLISNPLKIIFSSSSKVHQGGYSMILKAKNGAIIGISNNVSLYDGYVTTITRTPNVESAYIEVYHHNSKTTFKSEIFNPSTKGTVTIKYEPISDDQEITVSIKYKVTCTSNKKIRPNSGAWIVVQDLTTGKMQTFRTPKMTSANTDGALEIKLINGRRYKIMTTGLDNKLISYESLLDINNLKYDQPKGFKVNKLEYNKSTKTVEVEVEYVTNKC
jgi:hypothetical protein